VAKTLNVGLPTADAGPLPPSMRPNWFHQGETTALAEMRLLSNPGLERDSLDFLAGDSAPEFYAALRALFDTQAQRIAEPLLAGKRLLINCNVRTYDWLIDTTTANAVPADMFLYELSEECWYNVGLIPLEYGVDPDQILWSFRNEPETGPSGSAGGFTGTPEDLIRQYAPFAHGLKRASAGYRVGGCEFGNPYKLWTTNNRAVRSSSALELFLRGCAYPPADLYAGNRIPIDFLSYHWFIDFPWVTNFMVPNLIRRYGYDPDQVMQIMSESNFDLGDIGSNADLDRRNGELGAAHICQRMQICEEAQVDLHCYAQLRSGTLTAASGWNGGYGIYVTATGGAQVACTHKNVHTMCSLLGPRKIDYVLSDDAYNASILVTATADGNTRWLLISRCCTRNSDWVIGAADNDPAEQFWWEYRRTGRRVHRTGTAPAQFDCGLLHADLIDYLSDEFTLNENLSADVVAALESVKTRIVALQSENDDDVTLDITVDEPQHVSSFIVYTIDNTATNNPKIAYDTEYAIESDFSASVIAAQAEGGDLTATDTGDGGDFPYTLTLQPFQVTLIQIQSQSRTVPNPSSDVWEPKPIAEAGAFLRAEL
jgi:hypothetical protein